MTSTLANDSGAFGFDLAALGFTSYAEGDSSSYGPWLSVEHPTALVRVVTYTDDGNRVVVIGFAPERPAARLEAWRLEFTGSTPVAVAVAAVRAATEA